MRLQAASPHITVRALSNAEGYRLELTGPGDPEPLVMDTAEPTVLRRHHAAFSTALEQAKKAWQSPGTLDPREAGNALAELADAGRILLLNALRRPYDSVPELARKVARWCPARGEDAAVIPVVHIAPGYAQYLPWEALPLFDPYWEGPVEDVAGLCEAARVFPGLCTVVERGMEAGATQDPCLATTDGRLPLRFLWHAGYPGARAELGFFRSRPSIRLEGPSPVAGEPLPEPATLAQHMADPGLGLDGRRADRPHQVLHMSCHCVARPGGFPGDEANFAFHLASESGEDVEIPVPKILARLMRGWRAAPADGAAKPLVFLNACATAVYDPWSLESVVAPFHKNQNRGVIATAANLPDRLADTFSRRFYQALLTGGTAGEALHTAKWDLLQSRHNPLGLLYSLHGSSTLRVAPLPRAATAAVSAPSP